MMFNKGSPAAEFGLKVLLPTISAATVIAILLFTVVNGLLGQTDAVEASFGRQSAKALITHMVEPLVDATHATAHRLPLSEADSRQPDQAWLERNVPMLLSGASADAAFIIDAEGTTLGSITAGGVKPQAAETLLTPAVFVGLRNQSGGSGDQTWCGFDIKDGLFRAYAVSRIQVPAHAGSSATAAARYLLMVRDVEGADFAKDAIKFGLAGAKLVANTTSVPNSYPVTDINGRTIGILQWDAISRDASVRTAYGTVIWALLASLYFVIGMLVRMSWRSFRQASDVRSRAEASALRDDLTGLPNRRSMIDLLAGYLAQPKLADEGLSVIYADLDGFKEVNDSYGHEIGDMLLKSAAGGFEFLSRGRGVVARLGGDEFAVAVQGPQAAAVAREIAQNMLRFLAEPIVFAGRVASVSVSAGIYDRQKSDSDVDAEEILRRADAAMYAAKSAGRSRVQIYEPAMDTKREENRRIARELRTYIDSGSLGVVYQPIVDARTRRISGVEALVRWPKHAKTHYGPDQFVPVAEEFGMIEDLGYFVMMQACRQMVQWPSIFVSVNVSPIQFMNPSFAETVERILTTTGLPADRLEVEVTEGFIIDNAERAAAIIAKLHAMQVSVALDDFGTGYSSIGHLRRFRFDKLKLDRSMVTDILLQPSALRLVQGTIAMADALGMRVTAEGVEDENQVSVLRLAGCSQFQGYLFSKPVEAHQISAMLSGPRAAAV